ncbi:efflux RND transporter permease subunit [Tuwongella immobilis]|uniref:SSD domain-containing protein n=1 Tax=Tuwongella immobilis TaxID=692036 RepID=A0A6C2YSC9_9BACT|nr:cation multidrug efflux pump : Cation/multidrug efflux pump OS=Singulisphaera acidiphila (strain ATCC BAA-1392 / DSM 18658 / VKM B-2454 / MOB10) GN=Sinac_3859 PE=4 SV=1: ACR_tran: ACR_tran [Tuwongella immobilis]VTS05905.1 cation multidrug efflux pump : Cation/multidrug efflux pump OS=Singulisphaera acidiphila (strain ATCC BAA-1392 / DSM 18658 / VKM B-2454 / MOB10) GN=Sinac_3859 PE=4 SV=1: ACR_tran: ACR_tran [Tuwongella immobilis]
MLAKFFVDRPIFAWVISIVITLAGLAAALTLPIAQYPEISPPTISVSASYPGANARVVADTVAAPIEQQVNGVENMLYMSSQCTNDGNYTLTITFALGTDLNTAQVLVQNRVSLATAQLPDEVQRQGLNIKKKSPNILLVINLFSPDSSRDQLFLSNYATIQMKDEIARIPGVGDVTLFGQQDYSMRAWLNPEKMAADGITTQDVVNAIKEQNVQVAAGQIGQEPVPQGQSLQLTISTLGRLVDVQQFEKIVVKVGGSSPKIATGADVNSSTNVTDSVTRPAVLLKDIARVELTAKNQDQSCTLDGMPSVGLAIFQLPGSNALQVAEAVEAKLQEFRARFPTGIDAAVRYDTTPFITQSVEEVFNTLRDAIILVAIVVLCFLQDWRAMILPMIDVPVALTGTFAVMYLFGFSMNNLTLFGLVLAIGIVVDDAIVVLENIERWIAMGYDARTATIKAMGEVTGPIIAITLVLSCVFIPSTFVSGISGQFYRQFAIVIAASMAISAINAMTMSPARAVSIFKGQEKKHGEHHDPHAGKEALPWWGIMFLFGLLTLWGLDTIVRHRLGLIGGAGESASWNDHLLKAAFVIPGLVIGYLLAARVNWVLGRFFGVFNRAFEFCTRVYGRVIAGLLRISFVVMVLYGGLLFLTYLGLTKTPVGFIPFQDKGYLLVNVQLPDSASVQRTRAVLKQVDELCRGTPGVAHTIGIAGYSIVQGANGSNFASVFVVLEEFEERKSDHEKNGFAILFKLQAQLRREVQDAVVSIFPAPPVDGLGSAGGFKFIVEDRSDSGPDAIQAAANAMIAESTKDPGVSAAFTQYRSAVPQLYAEIDRMKCKQLGVQLSDVFNTLQVFLGGSYVNDFNRFGRTWQVNLQADAKYRVTADYVKRLKVRNDKGDMVLLGALARIEDTTGPVMVQRYNMYPSASINGSLAAGTSTGDGIRVIVTAAEKALPRGMTYEWTELFYLQQLEGSSAIYAFVGAVLLVFLVLAAQYESWSLPMSILLVVPMCVLSAIIGIRAVGLDINIFVQVGLIVLIGLAAKNAILIVEFAQQQRHEGLGLKDATLKAVEMRLRPIVMTSFAFILGVVPLVVAEGAGAEMRKTLGIAVFSGMLGVTIFGIFLTPVFYYFISRINGVPANTPTTPTPSDADSPPTPPMTPPSAAEPKPMSPPHAGH